MFLTLSKKSPYYQLTYIFDGKRTTISTKTKNHKVAKKFLSTFIPPDNIDDHVFQRNISNKLSDFRDEYVKFCQHSKSISYIENSIKPAFKFLLDFVGDIQLKELNIRTLDKFITARIKISESSAGLYYRTLKAAFSKAVAWEYLVDNPLKKIKAPKQVKSLPVFINQKELQLILKNTKHLFLKDIFTVAFYSGLRLSELLNMDWSWIDFKQNFIIVKNSNGFYTKNKVERVVPMHRKVKRVLNKLNRLNSKIGLIFYRTPGVKLNNNFVSKQFKKAVRQSDLNEKIHFHSLRHSFASNLVQRGINLYVVKELLGHEEIKTTQVYSHLQSENLMRAVDSL